MTNLENTKLILDNYSYAKDRPLFTSTNFEAYTGFHKETKLPVTIKIHKNFHPELPKYLKKLKQCKSQNIIRIYELAVDSTAIVLISEYAAYGNLANALKRCQRLEENDAISMSKLMLNGYVDLLRSDCTWIGTEEDVEFTENGIKLSWNNTLNLKNVSQPQLSLSKIIQKLSARSQTEKSLLPFPKSKIIQQLINVSKQSASQISLNSQIKKKQKLCKKKGKNWVAIKQISSKNQYTQEMIYLAVSIQYGFVKVKIYEKGDINSQILALNKTKQSFTQVFESYQQNGKTIIISNYSNDGSMQGYVSRLKSTGVKLTQEHIQFLFFSLFQPLKQIQNSSIKSIGMLNIKNIYLENGIPKIGQPIPMNNKLQHALKDRQGVPDFYHSRFKRQPNSKNQIYDTYSLGVLLYKLMYTEYPIFPQGRVHIPTAPNFNKRLKTTLETLLNEGGSLQSIQSKIQISETVVKQVKQNKQKLQKIEQKEMKVHKKSIQLSKRAIIDDLDDDEQHETRQDKTEHKSQQQEQFQDHINCCSICCHAIDLSSSEPHFNRFTNITALEQSPYKIYRICTKMVLVLIFYIFLFYFFFLQSNINFLSSQSKLQTYNVTIATKIFPIITDNVIGFQTQFNKTTRTLSSLTGLGCLIDDYGGGPNYSNFFISNPSGWIGYLVASLLSFVVIIILKAWKTYQFDLVRAIYNWDHGKFNYNITNFIIYNLQFSCLIFGHYYIFNLVFDGQTSPCYGSVNYYYHSSYALLNQTFKFLVPYVITFIAQFLVVGLHWVMKWRTHQIGYNKLINPIIIFSPFLIAQWIVLRIGAVSSYFYPNALQDNTVIKNYFLNGKYIDILGTIPEILWICEILIGVVVDVTYWLFLDKRRRLLIHDASAASLDQTIK